MDTLKIQLEQLELERLGHKFSSKKQYINEIRHFKTNST